MSDIVKYQSSQSAMSVASIAAASAMLATQALAGPVTFVDPSPTLVWPTNEAPIYQALHSASTYSFVERSLKVPSAAFVGDFSREIAAVYESLSEGQEPLGAEFEAAWDENIDLLYES